MRALPIFYIGFLLKKSCLLYPNKYDKYNYLFAGGLLLLTIGLLIFTQPALPLSATNWCSGILGYITLLTGALFFLILCKAIGNIPIISYLGRYSIIVLSTHHLIYRPIILIFSLILYNQLIVSWATFIATIGITFLIIPFCIKYLPYVTGQKDVFK